MKKHLKAAAVLAALALTAGIFSGCGGNSENESSSTPAAASADEISQSDESFEASADSFVEESSEDVTPVISPDSVSETESSTQDSESSESSKTESSGETSFASMTESEAIEASVSGYQFDDEQIVSDYHTAETFTDNDFFNDLFKDNALDKAFIEETKQANSTSDMLNLTAEYAAKWGDKAEAAYSTLKDELDKENAKKLEQSQKQWRSGLNDQEAAFRAEATGVEGSDAALSAQTAIMNYYKERAAKLLEQLYVKNGSIELSDYGL